MDFLMVIMASHVARGHVRMTTTESCKMAATLYLIGLTDIQPWFISYFFDIGHPYMSNITLDKDIQIAQLDI